MTVKDQIKQEFNEASEVLNAFQTEENFTKIEEAIRMMSTALKNGNKIIIIRHST